MTEQLSTDSSCAGTVCEACGEPFACGVTSAGCWCAELKLSEPLLKRLRERYTACLCRSCLERLAAEDERGP